MTKTPPPPPRPARTRKSFRPSARGSLLNIVTEPAKIEKLRPESPRPAELLRGIKAEEGAVLTALDVSVWEMVLSWAYEIDPEMTARAYSIPTSALRRYLGEFVKRAEVEESLKKISQVELSFGDYDKALYSGVRMIDAWKETREGEAFIGYQFVEPLRLLMSSMREYAHIELAAICAKKSSKHATPLYKYLALAASRRRWTAGEDNTFTVSLTPEALADVVDFPRDKNEKINVGKLTQLVVGHGDDYQLVRKFKATGRPVHASARGKPVERYDFDIRLMPPSPQHISARYNRGDLMLGGVDDARYQVRSDLWIRADNAFRKIEAFSGYAHRDFFKLWTVALKEAIDQTPLTPGYSVRQYRGESLIAAIEQEGADYAAWGLITEEVESPDLVTFLRVNRSTGQKMISLADLDRRERHGWKVDRKRVSVIKHFAKQRDAELTIAPELADQETVVNKNYDDSNLGYDFDTWPLGNFDTAKSVQLIIRDMSIEHLEEQVIPLLKSGAGDGRDIDVVLVYEDPATRSTQFFERNINLTFEEWTALLVECQPHMLGPEDYVND